MKKNDQLPQNNARLKCPTGHIPYPTQETAQHACDEHIADAKRHGAEGKAWKRLNVYKCWTCGCWHVGHAKQSWPERKAAEPQPKPLSPGQARRREERERKEAERHQRRAQVFADYRENIAYANWLLDRELALAAVTKTKDLVGSRQLTPNARLSGSTSSGRIA
jgi:hypothetical protein